MSYPDLPENRLIVNGVDLAVRYNMVLLDGYTLSPPEPKTTTVEIPGRDGVLDLTESLIGDVTYNNRSMTFTFLIVDLEQFEVVKTQVSNALHGRKFNFEMTMDPGYTYTGRFKITSYTHTSTWNHGICGYIEVEIDAEPYKLKSHYVYNLNATGGAMFQLPSGRKKVHPIVELTSPARIRFKNVVYRIGAGRFQLNDVLFEEGLNDIYINSYELQNLRWDEWKPIGPAKIYVEKELAEGEQLLIGCTAIWPDKDYPVMEADGNGYSYTFPAGSPWIGRNVKLALLIRDANGVESAADAQRPINPLLARTQYTFTWGSTDVTTSYYNGAQTTQWKEWTNVRWDELHKLEGDRIDVHQRWREFYSGTWRDMGKNSWAHANFHMADIPETSVKLEYDWKDL